MHFVSRTVAAKLAFSVVVFAVLLLGAELALRVRQFVSCRVWTVPGWLKMAAPEASVWHPFLRTMPRPSANFVEIENGEQARIEINSLGFRSPEISLDKPSGCFRVVCVGGSVVYDTRVEMRESWPFRLEALLRSRFAERQIEVVNAGIPSRTSADSLVNVGLRVLPLDPDVVIVLHGVNDQKPNRYPGFKPDYSHWYPPPPPPPVVLLNQMVDGSLLLSHLRLRFLSLINPHWHDNWRHEKLERYDSVTEPGLLAYERNIESIIGMCRAQGVNVVLATAAHSLQANRDWNESMGTPNPLLHYHATLTLEGIESAFDAYNNRMRTVARATNCALVDLEGLMPVGPDFFADDVHFTPSGSLCAAEFFAHELPWDEWLEAVDTTRFMPARSAGSSPSHFSQSNLIPSSSNNASFYGR